MTFKERKNKFIFGFVIINLAFCLIVLPAIYTAKLKRDKDSMDNLPSVLTQAEEIKGFIGGEKKFKPRRVTYITKGDKPTWRPTKPDEVVYVRAPAEDSHIAFYQKKDVDYFNATINQLREILTHRYMGRNLGSLMSIRELFTTNTQKLLMEWALMTKGSPYNAHPFSLMIYQLGVLATKPDPIGQQLSCRGCFRYDFRSILSPDKVCEGSVDVDIFAIITTIPKAYEERMAIRKTWGTWSANNTSNFRFIFLIGGGWPEEVNMEIRNEHLMYGDILQDDYIDGYYNLTYKVISGYKWIEKNCPRAKFVMRSADDNFVNIPHMIDLVKEYGHEKSFQDYQVGNCYLDYKPYRWPDYKGYVSTDEYRYDTFPPYALGTTFLTSMKLTKEILKHFSNVPFMSIEDSYFGILLWQMGRGCHDVALFNENSVQFAKPPYYSQHPVFPNEIYSFFGMIKNVTHS